MPSYSYSMLSTALRCNRLYQYLYIDKLKPDEPESLSLHFGTAIHAGINSLLEGGDGAAYRAYWASVADKSFAIARHSYDDLGQMGDVFIDRFTRLHLKHLKAHSTETRLYHETDPTLKLEGTPDFVGDYKGKLSVLDFKTSATRYPDDKVTASDQLMLYAFLAQQSLNIKIEQLGYMVFIKTKEPSIQVQIIDLDQEELAHRIQNILLQCRQLSEQDQPMVQNHNACFDYGHKCAFFDRCHKK